MLIVVMSGSPIRWSEYTDSQDCNPLQGLRDIGSNQDTVTPVQDFNYLLTYRLADDPDQHSFEYVCEQIQLLP